MIKIDGTVVLGSNEGRQEGILLGRIDGGRLGGFDFLEGALLGADEGYKEGILVG